MGASTRPKMPIPNPMSLGAPVGARTRPKHAHTQLSESWRTLGAPMGARAQPHESWRIPGAPMGAPPHPKPSQTP